MSLKDGIIGLYLLRIGKISMIILKSLLLALCSFAMGVDSLEHIRILLVTSIHSLLTDILKPKYRIACNAVFVIACIAYPNLLYFLPVLIYDLYFFYGRRSLILLIAHFLIGDHSLYLLTLSLLAIYLSYTEKNDHKRIRIYQKRSDDLREQIIEKEKKMELRDREQNDQVEIAILSERNRIAREIHDSVGHALSSCILQAEAIKLRCKDEDQYKKLETLQETLQNGMQDIRTSLHDLHDSSLDLRQEIQKLIDHFPLQVRFDHFTNEKMSYAMKLGILSATKESLTNTAKHSNAERIRIRLIEHKNYYSFSVKDDGHPPDGSIQKTQKMGIGLRSIEDLAKKYGGHLNYGYDNEGFFVHIILQKSRSVPPR